MSNKVSIITVVYNGEKSISKTIDSVLYQTYPNIEYIVVDGASVDNTLNIIKSYSDKISVCISEPDKGIYDAMNKGLNLVTGDWIIFMNAGDTFASQSVITDMLNMDMDNNIDLIFGDVNLITKRTIRHINQKKKNIKYESICHQSELINANTLKAVRYNSKLSIFADYEFQLKVFKKDRSKIIYVPITVANYDMSGISNKPFYKAFNEYKTVINNNVPFAERLGYYWYAIFKSVKSVLHPFLNK